MNWTSLDYKCLQLEQFQFSPGLLQALQARDCVKGEGTILGFPEIGVPLNHPFEEDFQLQTTHFGVPPF